MKKRKKEMTGTAKESPMMDHLPGTKAPPPSHDAQSLSDQPTELSSKDPFSPLEFSFRRSGTSRKIKPSSRKALSTSERMHIRFDKDDLPNEHKEDDPRVEEEESSSTGSFNHLACNNPQVSSFLILSSPPPPSILPLFMNPESGGGKEREEKKSN